MRLFMNLVNDSWLPILRKSGKRERITPWQLTESEDSILSLNTGRPDFDGALIQFLIGIFQTLINPRDEEEWEDWLNNAPSPAALRQRLNKKYAYAFDVQGEKGSFMEDFDGPFEDDETWKIDKMLIGYPGEKTLKENRDHFIKRGNVEALCPFCTVTALFTLQTNSPQGGRGHRTSLRGGGPLTTLVILDESKPDLSNDLWRNIWMNVLCEEDIVKDTDQKNNCPSDIFPWLGSTRRSDKEVTTPIDAHSLQVYWGMPRRIRINWGGEEIKSGECDLCGEKSRTLVSEYKTKTNGVNYTGSWVHPLTPYVVDQEKRSPMKTSPDKFIYKSWINFIKGSREGNSHSAEIVKKYLTSRRFSEEQVRLYVFGFHMKENKALCWYETRFPLLLNISGQERIKVIYSMIEAADTCASTLVGCIKKAWNSKKKSDMSFFQNEFYEKTEKYFFETIKKFIEEKENNVLEIWYRNMQNVAKEIFDSWAIQGDFVYSNPKAISKSRKKLCRVLEIKIKRILNLN